MEELLRELFIIALLSTVVIFACHKVKIPPIVGFLITGILCGPSSLGLVEDLNTVNTLAEIGIVFLLFSIGLEISISELIRLRKPVFLGGTFQVFITIGLFWLLTDLVWKDTVSADVFIGFLIALSSTAIALQTLQQKAMMDSPAGRISLSILIYQDLIIVPMMLAIPLLAGKGQPDIGSLALTAVRTLAIVVGVFLLARKVVPWFLRLIIGTKSRELFLISVIGVCLGTAFFTEEIGLSLSLGAFMAGLVVAESEYSHSALEGILPFKDVFTSMFFITVGMLLDTSFFFSHFLEVIFITCIIIVLKCLVIGIGSALLGYPLRTAIIVGLSLCQVGEFSFVLAKSGLDYSLLTQDHYQLFLAASILTMAATPFLIGFSVPLADMICLKFNSSVAVEEIEEEAPAEGLSDHLIILGFGVGGKLLARAARMAGIKYVVLEMNPDTVRKYKELGEPIVHGDAIHPAVLEHLGIRSARIIALVISDPTAVRAVTEIARHMNHHIHILVRTRFLGEVAALKELGANEVIPEEFETSIEIFIRILSKYLVPRGDIERFTHEVRAENYDMLRKLELPGGSISSLEQKIPELTVSVFTLEKEAPLAGKTFIEANLRRNANITVVAVGRGSEMFSHPGADFRLEPGDVVYVFSSLKDATAAESLFMGIGTER